MIPLEKILEGRELTIEAEMVPDEIEPLAREESHIFFVKHLTHPLVVEHSTHPRFRERTIFDYGYLQTATDEAYRALLRGPKSAHEVSFDFGFYHIVIVNNSPGLRFKEEIKLGVYRDLQEGASNEKYRVLLRHSVFSPFIRVEKDYDWMKSEVREGRQIPVVTSSTHPIFRKGTRFDYGYLEVALNEGYLVLLRSPESVGEIAAEMRPDWVEPYAREGGSVPVVMESGCPRFRKGTRLVLGDLQTAPHDGYSVLLKQPERTE